jgi:hypothetical protein
MREWLLGLAPVVILIDFVVYPGHMTWVLAAVRNALR